MTLTPKKFVMTNKDLIRQQVMEKLINKELKNGSAAKLLGISSRQIIRLKKKYKEWWIEAILHKLRWKESNHKVDKLKYEKALKIIKENYHDYGPTLASEKLEENHWIIIKSWTLRLRMIEAWIYEYKARKKTITQYLARPRKESFWELVQYDWSYHYWYEWRNWSWESCLLVSVDDATWKVDAKFAKNEWLVETFRFWEEYFYRNWKPKSIYLDKFATYKINHPNATDDKELPTQFNRACKQLWIELIFANSPQAKWRVERMNKTLQDRLVKALREANISDDETANKFLQEEFLPKFNKKFIKKAKNDDNLHLKLSTEENNNMKQIFSEHKTRKIANDYTINFERKVYQLYRIKDSKYFLRPSWEVTVEKHLDWTIHISKNWEYIKSRFIEEKPKRRNKLYTAPIIHLENETETKLMDYKKWEIKKDLSINEKKEKLNLTNTQIGIKEDPYYVVKLE